MAKVVPAETNRQDDKLFRLLHLFPIQTIREFFKVKGAGKSQVADAVLQNSTTEKIKEFARSNFGLTKQHVYLFASADMEDDIEIFDHDPEFSDDDYAFYLLPLRFQVLIADEPKRINLDFLWPVMISSHDKGIAVKTTVMEKDLSYYVGSTGKVYNEGQSLNDANVSKAVSDALGNVAELDLNKGIKYLWQNDAIDALLVEWEKIKSVSRDIMHEKFLFKASYPKEWAEVMKSPINRTIFSRIGKSQLSQGFPEYFVANPSSSFLSFPTFSENNTQVENVIRTILENN
jgi:hypothetical protein